jgi:hypothetical protein
VGRNPADVALHIHLLATRQCVQVAKYVVNPEAQNRHDDHSSHSDGGRLSSRLTLRMRTAKNDTHSRWGAPRLKYCIMLSLSVLSLSVLSFSVLCH